jgi:hypothetical protein
MTDLSVVVSGRKFLISLRAIQEVWQMHSKWVKAVLNYDGVKGEIHLPETNPKVFKEIVTVRIRILKLRVA